MKYCCEEFAAKADEQFEPDENGEEWNITGCCGGGCYVVTNMRFCPFCGARLEHSARMLWRLRNVETQIR